MHNLNENTSRSKPAAHRDAAHQNSAPDSTGANPVPRPPFVPGIPRTIHLLKCEDPTEFEALESLLRIEFNPRSNTEEMLFTEIVLIHWDQRRFRAIHTALLRMAESDPAIRAGFAHVEGVALAALAYKHSVGDNRALQAVSRDLTRLSRELSRTIRLYVTLHGPLNPPEPPADPPPPQSKSTESTVESKKIGPIPTNEHHPSAFYCPIANDFVRAGIPEVAPLTVGALHG